MLYTSDINGVSWNSPMAIFSLEVCVLWRVGLGSASAHVLIWGSLAELLFVLFKQEWYLWF